MEQAPKDYKLGDYTEMWYQRSWRPMMAAIYMLLCILDYGVRPMINYYQSTNFDLAKVVQTIEILEPAVQIEILKFSQTETMEPILTEFVHLSFGAILGVAAFSRGSSKGFNEGSLRRGAGTDYDNRDYDNRDYGSDRSYREKLRRNRNLKDVNNPDEDIGEADG